MIVWLRGGNLLSLCLVLVFRCAVLFLGSGSSDDYTYGSHCT
uniref:Uncharacterized protein n=1 Tax=Arundo donax TaxID=35708 RepID=A0A0A8Z7D1_ARUDO